MLAKTKTIHKYKIPPYSKSKLRNLRKLDNEVNTENIRQNISALSYNELETFRGFAAPLKQICTSSILESQSITLN